MSKVYRPAIIINLVLCFIILLIVKPTNLYSSSKLIDNIDNFGILSYIKKYFLDNSSNLFDYIHSEFINTFVLGESSDYIDRLFYQSGIIHMFSISGLHIGILFVVLNKTFKLIFDEVLAGVLSLICIASYGIMVYLSYATLRAIIMCAIYIVGSIIRRKVDSLNSLCIASIIIVIIYPQSIYAAGFILTFLITALLIIYYRRLKIIGYIFLAEKSDTVISNYFITVLAGFLASAPISIYYFGEIHLRYLVTNFMVAFVVPLLFVLICITLITGLGIFINIIYFFIDYIISVVTLFPVDYNSKITISITLVVISYIVIFYILKIFEVYNAKIKKAD